MLRKREERRQGEAGSQLLAVGMQVQTVNKRNMETEGMLQVGDWLVKREGCRQWKAMVVAGDDSKANIRFVSKKKNIGEPENGRCQMDEIAES